MIVKIDFVRKRASLLIAASFAISSTPAWADGNTVESDADTSGLTILNNATNVTHWGLGAGVGIQSSPYKGYGNKVVPIPLFYIDNKWVHAVGTIIDLKVGTWSGLSVALRGQVALFDGYRASDAQILNGMENRKGAFWYGPALEWTTGFGTLSGNFLLGGNKGERAKIGYGKSFDVGSFSIEPHVDVEWLSSKFVDYYYGVRAAEARAGRPSYNGTSTVNLTAGSSFSYKLTENQTIALDVSVTRLGSSITGSPLVGKRFIPEVRAAYVYRFK